MLSRSVYSNVIRCGMIKVLTTLRTLELTLHPVVSMRTVALYSTFTSPILIE